MGFECGTECGLLEKDKQKCMGCESAARSEGLDAREGGGPGGTKSGLESSTCPEETRAERYANSQAAPVCHALLGLRRSFLEGTAQAEPRTAAAAAACARTTPSAGTSAYSVTTMPLFVVIVEHCAVCYELHPAGAGGWDSHLTPTNCGGTANKTAVCWFLADEPRAAFQ